METTCLEVQWWGVKLTTHLHLVLRLGIRGITPPLQSAFMASIWRNLHYFFGPVPEFRKVTISLITYACSSVSPFVHMEKLGSPSKDYHEF